MILMVGLLSLSNDLLAVIVISDVQLMMKVMMTVMTTAIVMTYDDF